MGIYYSDSEDETIKLGNHIAKKLSHGDVVLLEGQLGCGKTRLAKGIINGLLGISISKITSPTYTIVNIYSNEIPVYHLDLYRLGNPEDIFTIEYEEYFFSNGIAIVEWPNILLSTIYQPDWHLIKIEVIDENQRKFSTDGNLL